jgi:hypothetical protein
VPVPDHQPLTEHDKAIAGAIAALLETLLAEIDRKLDRLNQRLDAITLHQRQASPRPRPPAKPCAHAQPRTPRARSCRQFRP